VELLGCEKKYMNADSVISVTTRVTEEDITCFHRVVEKVLPKLTPQCHADSGQLKEHNTD
jgi:hypothetical protein